MTDHIPAEAIEAAAKAMNTARYGRPRKVERWDFDIARAGLSAALPFLRPEPSEDERPTIALARAIASWDQGIADTARTPHWATNLAMELRELGYGLRRPTPSRDQIEAWVLSNFAVSNGTHAWVEFHGSVDGMTDAVLALLKGVSDE